MALMSVAFLLPFLGVLIRMLTASPLSIVLAGTALWIVAIGLFWWSVPVMARRRGEQISRGMIAFLTLRSAMTFAIFYALAVLITDALLKR